jgi:hypothetical protein
MKITKSAFLSVLLLVITVVGLKVVNAQSTVTPSIAGFPGGNQYSAGQTAYLSGVGFLTYSVNTVTIGSANVSGTFDGAHLTFTVPSLPAGTYPVYVTNADGMSNTLTGPNGLDVVNAPMSQGSGLITATPTPTPVASFSTTPVLTNGISGGVSRQALEQQLTNLIALLLSLLQQAAKQGLLSSDQLSNALNAVSR